MTKQRQKRQQRRAREEFDMRGGNLRGEGGGRKEKKEASREEARREEARREEAGRIIISPPT